MLDATAFGLGAPKETSSNVERNGISGAPALGVRGADRGVMMQSGTVDLQDATRTLSPVSRSCTKLFGASNDALAEPEDG